MSRTTESSLVLSENLACEIAYGESMMYQPLPDYQNETAPNPVTRLQIAHAKSPPHSSGLPTMGATPLNSKDKVYNE